MSEKIKTSSLIAAIGEEIDNYPRKDSDYIRGLKRAIELISIIEAREAHQRRMTKQGTIQLLEGCDCDFRVETREYHARNQSVTVIFNGVEFTIEAK